ncbi:MAG: HEAT repeat domain-containing protein [bacterium]
MRHTNSKKINILIKNARKDEDLGIRRQAIIDLGYEKRDDIYPVLVEMLDDTSSSIKHAAVISLGRFGDSRAIEELIKPKIFNSPITNIRWAAVIAVGQLGDYRIINYLLTILDDREWIVRNQVVTELKDKIQEMIKLKDSSHSRILLKLLSLDNEEIIKLAIDGFCALGEESVNILLDTLRSLSSMLRKNAARTLGELTSFRAVDSLINIIDDEEWKVRKSVVKALGEIGDRKAIEPLVNTLSDNVEMVQKQAMESLLLFGKLSTNPLLNALSFEKDKFNLRAIILTLGRIGDEKAIPVLVNHLRSSYFVVRMATVNALKQFKSSVVKEVLIEHLSFNDSDITQLLADAENKDNKPLQLRAIKALGGLEDHRAVDTLKKLVEVDSPEVQDAAIQSLIRIGCAAWGRCCAVMVLSSAADKSFLPLFCKSLEDDSDNVRLEAVRAIAKIGGKKAVDSLVEIAQKDRDANIRFEAVRYLRRIGVGYNQVLDFALKALKDKSRDVRYQAARLLGNFHHELSIQPLLEATADKHWSVRESAENALINFGQKAVTPLIKALSKSSWTTRFRAARLLGEIGDTRAIKPLEQLLKQESENEEVKQIVDEALQKLYRSVAA